MKIIKPKISFREAAQYRAAFLSFVCILLINPFSTIGQSQKKMQLLAKQKAESSMSAFIDFLKIPNNAAFKEDIERNIQWCETEFELRGFKSMRLETGHNPLLLAERINEKAKKTVLFYFHADGQPVDTSKWFQADPYIPVFKQRNSEGGWETIQGTPIPVWKDENRLFARSTSDAKGPIVMFLQALDAVEELGIEPDFTVKIIIDFEEEASSPGLPQAVRKYEKELAADMLVILDGPRHFSNKPTITFGARGISAVTLTTYGPILPQHSGHYGNYLPNPAYGLSRILASLKDEEGRVLIPGFYDGIELDSKTKERLRAVPDDPQAIKERMQVATVEQVGQTYQEALQYPSLNIRGMQSAWIDEEVRTIIPARARAEIDIRLVKESDPERLIQLLKKHCEGLGYHLVDHVPTREERMKYPKLLQFNYRVSYQSFRTEIDSEVGRWMMGAFRKAFGEDPVIVRMMGGSVPISPFVNTLDVPAVILPTANPDNNQHSPNENIRLGNYREGILAMISLLTSRLK